MNLFMVCVFPIHFWAAIIMFLDLSWVAERTDTWDAIGYTSYVLNIAFVDSLIFFIAVVILGLLLPWRWEEDKRAAVLSGYVLVLSFWVILNQLNFFPPDSYTSWTQTVIQEGGHPLRYGVMLLAFTAAAVPVTAILPVWGGYRSEKYVKKVSQVGEGITLLSGMYLILDLTGFLVIVWRNLV